MPTKRSEFMWLHVGSTTSKGKYVEEKVVDNHFLSDEKYETSTTIAPKWYVDSLNPLGKEGRPSYHSFVKSKKDGKQYTSASNYLENKMSDTPNAAQSLIRKFAAVNNAGNYTRVDAAIHFRTYVTFLGKAVARIDWIAKSSAKTFQPPGFFGLAFWADPSDSKFSLEISTTDDPAELGRTISDFVAIANERNPGQTDLTGVFTNGKKK
jgi:hypothetical protein